MTAPWLTVSRSWAPRLDMSTSARRTWWGHWPACGTWWSRGIGCRGCPDWWPPRHAPSHTGGALSWRPPPNSRSSSLIQSNNLIFIHNNFYFIIPDVNRFGCVSNTTFVTCITTAVMCTPRVKGYSRRYGPYNWPSRGLSQGNLKLDMVLYQIKYISVL